MIAGSDWPSRPRLLKVLQDGSGEVGGDVGALRGYVKDRKIGGGQGGVNKCVLITEGNSRAVPSVVIPRTCVHVTRTANFVQVWISLGIRV